MTKDFESDCRFMEAALELAKAAGIDIPVGAVIVKGSEIIAGAANEKEKHGDPTAHAEIVAIRQACQILGDWRLSGCTIYTTLEPCPMCAEAILQARIDKVVFAAYDELSGALGSKFNLYIKGRIYNPPQVLGGIMEAESSRLLKEFFKSLKHK